MSEFDEYIVHGEPGQKEKADDWQTEPSKVQQKISQRLHKPQMECMILRELIQSYKKMQILPIEDGYN